MPRAILSVHDKAGLVEFARGLDALGWTLLASGGTARILRENNLPVTEVAEYTRSPEILDGRVKTLHPAIHGGLLARRRESDHAQLAQFGWDYLDLVAVNLYPFEQTIAKPDVTLDEAIENIDIGGVTLIRAAAKNYQRVTLICDPADYGRVLDELRAGGVAEATRQELALKGFRVTSRYDAAILDYLSGITSSGQEEGGHPVGAHAEGAHIEDAHAEGAHIGAPLHAADGGWTRDGEGGRGQGAHIGAPLRIAAYPVQVLRYGENPHQRATLYATTPNGSPLGGMVLQGKELSYNNLLDLDAAWRAAVSFATPAVCIVKHLSPCGIAVAESICEAFRHALASDPISAFGGVIASNRAFDAETANALGDLFVECIAAPSFTPEARAVLVKRKNCRLVEMPDLEIEPRYELRTITRGFLQQDVDFGDPAGTEWQVVSKRAPTDEEWQALRFAWAACQHVKSNAIVLARADAGGAATVGIGGGQPNRVDCVKIAAERAGARARGAVMASDAFFPFPDSVEVAARAGITAVVHPGGSVRDAQSLAAADAANMAMAVTGVRHFRH